MMYNNKFVAALKVNGKILREFNDTVYIPFQSEYSILLKNLNPTKKSLVNISIDNNNILSDGLVLLPNQEIELERSIINGNLNEGNKFKFIEKTESIENHRGIKLEDGLIQIKFKFELPVFIGSSNAYWIHHYNDTFPPNNIYGTYYREAKGNYSTNITCCSSNITASATINNVGITVPGSHSNQKFQTTSSFPLEAEEHVIIFKLLGQNNNELINKPISTKTKQKCITCGRTNKINAKFCSNCGTNLTVY